MGGAAWNGTLPRGGTFSGGQLTLSANSQQYVQLPATFWSNSSAGDHQIVGDVSQGPGMAWNTFFYGFGNTDGSGSGEVCVYCAPPQTGRIAITAADPGYNGEQNATGAGDFSYHFHAVLIRPGGTLALYLNGALAAINNSVLTLTG